VPSKVPSWRKNDNSSTGKIKAELERDGSDYLGYFFKKEEK